MIESEVRIHVKLFRISKEEEKTVTGYDMVFKGTDGPFEAGEYLDEKCSF